MNVVIQSNETITLGSTGDVTIASTAGNVDIGAPNGQESPSLYCFYDMNSCVQYNLTALFDFILPLFDSLCISYVLTYVIISSLSSS